MEIPPDDQAEALDDNSINVENLLNSEIWDEADVADVEDDFPENTRIESLPNVDARMNLRCRSFNVLLSRWLVVMLVYFWKYFHISDDGMEFCLLG